MKRMFSHADGSKDGVKRSPPCTHEERGMRTEQTGKGSITDYQNKTGSDSNQTTKQEDPDR